MPDLEGSLKIFEPIVVLQILNLAQVTGELKLESRDNSANIYFESGNVSSAGIANRPVRLGEALLKDKLITKSVLNKILRKKGKGQRLGKLLIEEGVITETDLRGAVEDQIKEVIYEIVRWGKGYFVFVQGEKPKSQDITINIPLDHLMLEGLKRLDEERESV